MKDSKFSKQIFLRKKTMMLYYLRKDCTIQQSSQIYSKDFHTKSSQRKTSEKEIYLPTVSYEKKKFENVSFFLLILSYERNQNK